MAMVMADRTQIQVNGPTGHHRVRRHHPEWSCIHIPEHISYFSRHSMDRLFIHEKVIWDVRDRYSKVFQSSFNRSQQAKGDGPDLHVSIRTGPLRGQVNRLGPGFAGRTEHVARDRSQDRDHRPLHRGAEVEGF